MLYPFKFNPIQKKRAWGSELWLLSGLEEDLTEVSNGFLEENSINELTEVYMGEVVGDKIYDKYSYEFPLLIKTIDAKERLSVQVHPNDELAAKRHGAYGKSELWYILEAAPDSVLYIGFKKGTTKESYLDALAKGEVESLLNKISVKKGDVYFIPSGTVHSIGGGIQLLEIQQTSDITYRIFDWNRKNENQEPRELHTELALDAIQFDSPIPTNLGSKEYKGAYFNTSILDVTSVHALDYGNRDSFTVLYCLEGSGEIEYDTDAIDTIEKGELLLIPSELEDLNLFGKMKLMEIYI